METPVYQLFGSPSSEDIDVVFFVDKIPSIKEASLQSKAFAARLASQLSVAKVVNANLAVLGVGQLINVYKGTTDELNNALYYTYKYHNQIYPLQIEHVLKRDIGLKSLRCARVVLSFLSRTTLRKKVKTALQGDLIQKLRVLSDIQLKDFTELGKHGGLVEFYKTAAFQLGQTLALRDGVELYTKESVACHFPKLTPYLMRKTDYTAHNLQAYLDEFIRFAQAQIPNMYSLKEYRYQL